MDPHYILPFEDCTEGCVDLVGGKSMGLGTMIRAGIPVPPGIAVTTNAYRAMLGTGRAEDTITKLLNDVDPNDVDGLEEVSQRIRAGIEARQMPPDVEVAIRRGYEELTRRSGWDLDMPVAVRSSATAEDLAGASFAGQQDTFLWIVGADEVVAHVKRCWSSLYTGRAIAYRTEQGFDHDKVYMSVCIQKMVNARAAGVMFTLNPINGDRSKVVIDATWGLGEAVASGEVTPDNYIVDKIAGRIARRTVSLKTIEYRAVPAKRRVEKVDVPEERRAIACITDDEILALTKLARRVESHQGRPLDLEWAVDADLNPPDHIVLLQSRPETVWSEKDRVSVSTADKSTLDHIVANLLAGVRVRGDKPATGGSEGGD